MKNTEFFPFQRNSYYTGKLLSVRDFRAEQKYFNDKRRLLNRMLMGVGIVCGFTVSRLDGSSIIIESGLALDGSGRELALDTTLIKKLSALDGFSKSRAEMSRYVYLCIEYAEEETEPMHGIDDNSIKSSNYNRISEGVRFFLTYEEPRIQPDIHNRTDNLEKELKRREFERIYLAKMEVIRWGEAYEIGEVIPVPFGQYVRSRETMMETAFADEISNISEDTSQLNPAQAETTIASGTTVINMPKGAKEGQAFYSDAIEHGLDSGNIFINLSLQSKGSKFFGSPSVFAETAAFEYAASLDKEGKSFKVGVLLKNESSATSVTINWCAYTVPSTGEISQEPTIAISPATTSLKSGGKQVYKAQLCGLKNRDVVWSVAESEGGYIDGYGSYTAPQCPGVYTIIATSVTDTDIQARAYVVVDNER